MTFLRLWTVAILSGLTLTSGCKQDRTESSDRQGRARSIVYPSEGIGQADPDPEGAARAQLGVVFDPSQIKPGDSIAGLVVEKISATRTVMDSTYVGTAAFRGEVELTGSTMRHPEADAASEVCFGADSASAARLPRWSGDRRRAWFCFWNKDAAARALGPARTERRARIVIANFVIHRNLTDAVNAARLVRLVPDSAALLEGAAKEMVGFLAFAPPAQFTKLVGAMVVASRYIRPLSFGGYHVDH